MSTTMVQLPRPLKNGELFCHRCGVFVVLAKRPEHQKTHGKQQTTGRPA